jgi:Zn-dependent protease with chaperone function
MPKRLRIIFLFLLVMGFFVLPALADRTNIRPAWNLFTTQQDTEMGRLLANDVEGRYQLVTDAQANTYLDALGKQLAVHAPGYNFRYEFKIVADDNVNAWALPGGIIYVTSGLIQSAQNEPQLAGILAHEIAHIVLRHGTAEVSQAYNNGVSNGYRGGTSVNDAMSRLNIRFDQNAIPFRYSREEERQADVIATQIMFDTSFDPQQMTRMFQRLTDHPPAANRVATVRTELRNLGGLRANLRGDSPDLHTAQDRLLAWNGNGNDNRWPSRSDRYGRNQTYRAGNIEFQYPDNWQVSGQGDSISIAPYNGFVNGSMAYGMTIATFDPQTNRYYGRNSFVSPGTRVDTSNLSSATNQLLDELRQSNPNLMVVGNSQRRNVDGSQAMVLELRNESPLGGAETDWLVTVLRPNGLLRYFVGVAPQNEFNRYRTTFEDIVNSARFLD